MDSQEYSKLCEVYASLNVALAAMNDKVNGGFTDAKRTAWDLVLKAYTTVDKMLIKSKNYDYQSDTETQNKP